MCHQRLQRALINHGDDAAFNSSAQQISHGSLALFLIDSCIRFPALILRVDIGKHFVERFELEEAVKSECDRMTILQQQHSGRGDKSLQRELLCARRHRHRHSDQDNAKCRPTEQRGHCTHP